MEEGYSQPAAAEELLLPSRYGSARLLVETATDASAVVSQPSGNAGCAETLQEVLRRIFRAHPGLPSMSAWLEEEGLHTLAQLRQAAASQQPALAPAEAVQRYLRELGFHDAWASALAAVAHKT